MLACVILLRVNRKARTKPICLWGVNPSRHFQCLALDLLSYINVIAECRKYLWGCSNKDIGLVVTNYLGKGPFGGLKGSK